ncbi:MAG: thioredoxin [Candidatus Anammoxibacter sp.]
MADANVCILTDSNFDQEVIKADIPVLVDFWAEWCGPCKLIAPIVSELAEEYAGKIKVCKIDTDGQQKTAATYGVSAIPTIIVFKGGKDVERMVGAKSKKDIKTLIDAQL